MVVGLEGLIVIDDDRDLEPVMDWGEFKRRVERMVSETGDRLTTVFELQRELDGFIDRLRGISRDDKRLWIRRNALAGLMEVTEFIDGLNWKWWVNPEELDRKYLTEELADVLHFLASAVVTAGVNAGELAPSINGDDRLAVLFKRELTRLRELGYTGGVNERLALDTAVELINTLSELYGSPDIYKYGLKEALSLLARLSIAVGVSDDGLFRAYVVKNFKNRLRQLSKGFRGGKYYTGDVIDRDG